MLRSLKNSKTKIKKSIFPQEIKILLDKFFKTLDYLEKNESK